MSGTEGGDVGLCRECRGERPLSYLAAHNDACRRLEEREIQAWCPGCQRFEWVSELKENKT